MAGLAANVDEAWRRSAKHLRDMALENESRLVSNRELAGRVAVIHPELVDAYKRVVPALDEKREAFRRRIQTRERSALERFRRIDQSRDEAVPFHDIGGGRADGGDGDDDGDGPFASTRRAASAGRAVSRADAEASARLRVFASEGVFGMLKLATRAKAAAAKNAASSLKENIRAPRGRSRRADGVPPRGSGARFADGKAAAAMRRVAERRVAEAALDAAKKAAEEAAEREREEADAREREARRLDAVNNTAKSRLARAALAAARISAASSIITGGSAGAPEAAEASASAAPSPTPPGPRCWRSSSPTACSRSRTWRACGSAGERPASSCSPAARR